MLAFSGTGRLSDSPILRGNKLQIYATAILTEIFKLSQYSKKPDLKTAAAAVANYSFSADAHKVSSGFCPYIAVQSIIALHHAIPAIADGS